MIAKNKQNLFTINYLLFFFSVLRVCFEIIIIINGILVYILYKDVINKYFKIR